MTESELGELMLAQARSEGHRPLPFKPVSRPNAKKVPDAARRAEARRLLAEGLTHREAGKRMGISHVRVIQLSRD